MYDPRRRGLHDVHTAGSGPVIQRTPLSHVCVYVYIHVYTCVYIIIYMQLYTYTCLYRESKTHIRMHVSCVFIHAYILNTQRDVASRLFAHVYMQILMSVYICVHMYIRIHMYTRIYTFVYASACTVFVT